MKKLINKYIGVIIVLMILSRTVFQPYGSECTYIDYIIFNSIRYFFSACLLFYVSFNHNESTTKVISFTTALYFIVILIEELYFIGKPELFETAHRTAYWEGNLYMLILFTVSVLIDKFTTLFSHGKMDFKQSGFSRFIFFNNRDVSN